MSETAKNPEYKTKNCLECKCEIKYKVAFIGGREFPGSPKYCEPCYEKMQLDKQTKIQKDKVDLRQKQWENLCPPLYQDSDSKRFNPKVWSKVGSWHPNAVGMLLHGCTGVCKTRMVWHLIKKLYLVDKCSIKAFGPSDFGLLYGKEKQKSLDAAYNWILRLANVDIVFIDDLEKMIFTETVKEGLFALIEKRTGNCKPFIVTTNLDSAGLKRAMNSDKSEYGTPFVRRLIEFCEVVAC